MDTETVRHDQLREGNIVNVQGYWFVVSGIRVASKAGEKTTMHSEPNRADVIRYTGKALDETLRGSGYDGATYGAYADVPVMRRTYQYNLITRVG